MESRLSSKGDQQKKDPQTNTNFSEVASSKVFSHIGFAIDFVLIIFLLIAACYLRLYNIDFPNRVVFDEFHFGKFISGYINGNYFFDIHPPLGKLVLSAVAYFNGYKGDFSFDQVSQVYPKSVPFIQVRSASALFAAGCAPLMYVVARQWGISRSSSFLCATMSLFDNLLATESRFILINSQLMFYIILSWCCALRLVHTVEFIRVASTKQMDDDPRKKLTAKIIEKYIWLCLTAVTATAAMSTKYTALITPVMIAVMCLYYRVPILDCMFAGFLAIALYAGLFYIHFQLLPNAGDGSRFMKHEFNRVLIGHEHYNPNATAPSFITNFIYLNRQMYERNKGIATRHPYESKWYTWPLNLKGVKYYAAQYRTATDEKISVVFLIGNLVAFYFMLVGVLGFFFLLLNYLIEYKNIRKNDSTDLLFKRSAIFVIGYVLNLLPYILVDRCAFLYHYLPAMFFAQLLVSTVLDVIPHRFRLACISIVLLLLGGAYWYWSPWIYGTPITFQQNKDLAIMGQGWE